MSYNIVKVLMKRDGCTKEEAINQVKEVKAIINEALARGDYEDAFYACEYVGLEPDYLFEVI